MADTTNTTSKQAPDQAGLAVTDEVPVVADPGGAHRKGYSAQPGPARPVPEDGPVPLADDADVHAHVQKPDQPQAVPPSTSGGYGPNDRVMGGGR